MRAFRSSELNGIHQPALPVVRESIMHIYRRDQQYEYGYANLQTTHKVTVSTRIHKSKKYLPAPGVRAIKTELPRSGYRRRGGRICREAAACGDLLVQELRRGCLYCAARTSRCTAAAGGGSRVRGRTVGRLARAKQRRLDFIDLALGGQ
jgi:hypothetical protein